jgi:transcriptional regulator with XRE-family HTH domain
VLKKVQSKIIGSAIARRRKRAGFSQEALAEKAGIHPNYVGRIERGQCSASLETFLKLAKALNVRPYKFFLKL